jgi:hypothetical protein
MRARIDGAQWTANVGIAAVNNTPGRYFISSVGSLDNYTITFVLLNITGPGTYPLGVYGSMHGGDVSVTQPGARSWINPYSGNAGQIVITQLGTRMVGTFNFVAEAGPGNATGTRTVTEGEFDIPINQLGGVALPNMGSSFTANVGTAFYVNQVSQQLVGNDLHMVAMGPTGQISISIMQMTGTNVYSTSTSIPIRTIALGQTSGGWGTQAPGGNGTVSLTVTADRFSGTFNATVAPTGGGAIGTRTISGTFSIGRAP